MLEAARALPRSERAEVAQELIATLEATSEYDEVRYAELKAAAQLGIDQVERGEGIRIPAGELRAYIHELNNDATDRVARKSG